MQLALPQEEPKAVELPVWSWGTLPYSTNVNGQTLFWSGSATVVLVPFEYIPSEPTALSKEHSKKLYPMFLKDGEFLGRIQGKEIFKEAHRQGHMHYIHRQTAMHVSEQEELPEKAVMYALDKECVPFFKEAGKFKFDVYKQFDCLLFKNESVSITVPRAWSLIQEVYDPTLVA